MTEEEERALLASAIAGITVELREAFDTLLGLIRGGTEPRVAVQQVVEQFGPAMASTLAAALSDILGQSVGQAQALQLQVGQITLSRRLYTEATAAGEVVQGVVQRHALGFLDARGLALQLFEGYAFREPDAEPLQFNARNPRLPQYLREALLSDGGVASQMSRAFAGLQVSGLQTGPLRAAYADVLRAIDNIEGGVGARALDKKLEIAWFERMRYFASRISRTELHRAYAWREARRLLDDPDLEYVQLIRAPGRQLPCICALFTGRDLYGLGKGVYPKAQCPVPTFHPHCMCVMSPRFDLRGVTPKDKDPEADAYFLRRLKAPIAARVMGSKARRDVVLRGTPAEAVVNAGRDSQYWIKTAAQV